MFPPRKGDGLFYVYELCAENGRSFYVGKGKAYRWTDHIRDARNGLPYPVHNKIRKQIRDGRSILYRVVFQTDKESDALKKEIDLIAFYGKENLMNVTNGGDGVSGLQAWNKGISPSQSTRQKISAALKGIIPKSIAKCWTPEARAKHSATTTGRKMPPETRAKISATLKRKGIKPPYVGGHMPDDVKKRIGASMRAKKRKPNAEAHRKSAYSKGLQSLLHHTRLTGYCGA